MSGARATAVRTFLAGMSLAGSICLLVSFTHWQSNDWVKFCAYLVAALFSSSLKVSLLG